MKSSFLPASLVAGICLLAQTAANAAIVFSESFESPAVTAPSGFLYLSGSVGGWNWGAVGGGLIHATNGAPWFGAAPPSGYSGSQYALLQSNVAQITHQIVLDQDSFVSLSWVATGRPQINSSAGGNTTYTASLGSLTASGSTTSGQNFASSSLSGLLSAGTYTLSFTNTAPDGDRTLFLDSVALSAEAVPEPASLGLLGAALSLLAARRRRG